MAETKKCSKCGLELDLSEFSKRATGTLNTRCKTCCRGAVRIQKSCVVCGTTSPATDKSKKKFCSSTCKKQHDLQQQSSKLAEKRKTREAEIESQRLDNEKKYPDIFLQYKDLPTGRSEAIATGSDLYFTGLL